MKSYINNFNVIDISPKMLQKDASKLLPNTLTPESCTFELHNVNVAIANAIRRVILLGIKTKIMTVDINSITTNDELSGFKEFIRDRIRNIPIKQSIPLNTKLRVDFRNGTQSPQYVMSGEMGDNEWFNKTIALTRVDPKRFIQIEDITIEEGYGYQSGHYAVAHAAYCVPIDIEMYNMYEKTGISSSVSNPMNHKIGFETNGCMDCKKIIARACKNILERLDNIAVNIELTALADIEILRVLNEDDTTGNIIVKTLCELYPKISFVTYKIDSIDRTLTIEIRDDNAKHIIEVAIKKASDILNMLISSI